MKNINFHGSENNFKKKDIIYLGKTDYIDLLPYLFEKANKKVLSDGFLIRFIDGNNLYDIKDPDIFLGICNIRDPNLEKHYGTKRYLEKIDLLKTIIEEYISDKNNHDALACMQNSDSESDKEDENEYSNLVKYLFKNIKNPSSKNLLIEFLTYNKADKIENPFIMLEKFSDFENNEFKKNYEIKDFATHILSFKEKIANYINDEENIELLNNKFETIDYGFTKKETKTSDYSHLLKYLFEKTNGSIPSNDFLTKLTNYNNLHSINDPYKLLPLYKLKYENLKEEMGMEDFRKELTFLKKNIDEYINKLNKEYYQKLNHIDE